MQPLHKAVDCYILLASPIGVRHKEMFLLLLTPPGFFHVLRAACREEEEEEENGARVLVRSVAGQEERASGEYDADGYPEEEGEPEAY